MNLTYRDAVEQLSPSWLSGTRLGRVMYVIGVHLDLLIELAVLAVWLRFPRKQAAVDVLTWIGRDRGIVRGFDETDASYAERCARWIVDRRRRGSPYALMRQVQGYLSGHAVTLRVVNARGHWHELSADGVETWSGPGSTPWNWDTADASYATLWYLIVMVPATLWSINPPYGATVQWGDTTRVMGFDATPAQIATMRMLLREWGAPHARCAWMVFAFAADSFEPGAVDSATTGTWGPWGLDIASGRIMSRSTTARYVSGRIDTTPGGIA